jgi:hypothetical protein
MKFDSQAFMIQSTRVTHWNSRVDAELPHNVDNDPRPLIIVPVVLIAGRESSSTAVELKALLDTGANSSLITSGVVARAGFLRMITPMPAEMKATSASQHSIPLRGFIRAPLRRAMVW